MIARAAADLSALVGDTKKLPDNAPDDERHNRENFFEVKRDIEAAVYTARG